jgi:D-xylulose reductase
VSALKPGDRVALEPGATCRVCVHCKNGRYEVISGCPCPYIDRLTNLQLCQDIRFAATPPTDGTLARFYRLPADVAYRLPDNLTLEDGAMVCFSSSFSINPKD